MSRPTHSKSSSFDKFSEGGSNGTVTCRFLPYVWPTFIVWGLDRILRLSRIVYIRYHAMSRATAAEVCIKVLSSDSLSVTIPIRRSALFGWRAGQFVYLLVPKLSRYPFEAHPFTIATISPPLPPLAEAGTEEASACENEKDGVLELKLIVRVREGFTRRLHSYATRAPSPSDIRLSTLIDGPYGYPPNVHVNPTVIFIAGESFHLKLVVLVVLTQTRRIRCYVYSIDAT